VMSQTYHEDDKEGLRVFLRQPSAITGKINAEQLGLKISDTLNWQTDEKWVSKVINLTWNKESPKQLIGIGDFFITGKGWDYKRLAGILDATKWTKLTSLNCLDNQLIAINISNNIELWELNCFGNKLTALDLSNNKSLHKLNCSNNKLTSLDISNNTRLGWLDCTSNKLTILDTRNHEWLRTIKCYDNKLRTLNLSADTNLVELWCGSNQLTSLILNADAKKLYWLSCDDNRLFLSDLFAVSEIMKKSGTAIYQRHLGTQNLPEQTVSIGKELEFSTPQDVFNGTYTKFTVTKNNEKVSKKYYTVKNGKITFNKIGVYTIKMTNKAIISSKEYPAEVIIKVKVRE